MSERALPLHWRRQAHDYPLRWVRLENHDGYYTLPGRWAWFFFESTRYCSERGLHLVPGASLRVRPSGKVYGLMLAAPGLAAAGYHFEFFDCEIQLYRRSVPVSDSHTLIQPWTSIDEVWVGMAGTVFRAPLEHLLVCVQDLEAMDERNRPLLGVYGPLEEWNYES